MSFGSYSSPIQRQDRPGDRLYSHHHLEFSLCPSSGRSGPAGGGGDAEGAAEGADAHCAPGGSGLAGQATHRAGGATGTGRGEVEIPRAWRSGVSVVGSCLRGEVRSVEAGGTDGATTILLEGDEEGLVDVCEGRRR